jgi:hypothetical protein
MAFADNTPRTVLCGLGPVQITLAGTVQAGDPVGYSSGWKAADGNGAVYASLVAGEDGDSGDVITAFMAAVVTGFTGGTAGNPLYISDTAGDYSESAGTVAQVVGRMASATDAFVQPFSAGVVLSGDVSTDAAGVTTIGANKVLKTMLAGGFLKVALVAGGSAGDHTVTGAAAGDELVFVGHLSTAASIATLADLTSEFTIGDGVINNAAGTDTSSDSLLVFYLDLT